MVDGQFEARHGRGFLASQLLNRGERSLQTHHVLFHISYLPCEVLPLLVSFPYSYPLLPVPTADLISPCHVSVTCLSPPPSVTSLFTCASFSYICSSPTFMDPWSSRPCRPRSSMVWGLFGLVVNSQHTSSPLPLTKHFFSVPRQSFIRRGSMVRVQQDAWRLLTLNSSRSLLSQKKL